MTWSRKQLLLFYEIIRNRQFDDAKDDLSFGKLIGERACGLVAKCNWQGKTCVAKMLRAEPGPNKLNHGCLLIEVSRYWVLLAEIGANPNLVEVYGARIEEVTVDGT